jgi:hypothetical protein
VAAGWVMAASSILLVACSDDAAPTHELETRVITDWGGTCGNWQTSPPGETNTTRIEATCAKPLLCKHQSEVTPPGESGNRYGFCLPEEALSCDLAAGKKCPEGLRCETGFGLPSPGGCYLGCARNADCPGPFQLCLAGDCRIVECPMDQTDDDAVCGSGNHCDRGVCIGG